MWIKIILVVVIIIIGLLLVRPPSGDRHLALRRLFMVFLVAVAIISVLIPQWLTWLAHLVGVGRGTDFLLYALVIAFLVFVSTAYRRNVLLDRKITQLARAATLAEGRAQDAERRAASADSAADDARVSKDS
ncbi:hypothetical protein GCM10027568_01720 [Humibacter soli]